MTEVEKNAEKVDLIIKSIFGEKATFENGQYEAIRKSLLNQDKSNNEPYYIHETEWKDNLLCDILTTGVNKTIFVIYEKKLCEQLMLNQQKTAEKLGFKVVRILSKQDSGNEDSKNKKINRDEIIEEIKSGIYDIVFVSYELFYNNKNKEIQELGKSTNIIEEFILTNSRKRFLTLKKELENKEIMQEKHKSAICVGESNSPFVYNYKDKKNDKNFLTVRVAQSNEKIYVKVHIATEEKHYYEYYAEKKSDDEIKDIIKRIIDRKYESLEQNIEFTFDDIMNGCEEAPMNEVQKKKIGMIKKINNLLNQIDGMEISLSNSEEDEKKYKDFALKMRKLTYGGIIEIGKKVKNIAKINKKKYIAIFRLRMFKNHTYTEIGEIKGETYRKISRIMKKIKIKCGHDTIAKVSNPLRLKYYEAFSYIPQDDFLNMIYWGIHKKYSKDFLKFIFDVMKYGDIYTKVLKRAKKVDYLLKFLHNGERYIARSEYKSILNIDSSEDLVKQHDNNIDYIDKHNIVFISKSLVNEQDYLDNILKDADRAITLDKEQREALLTDEDYCLVIAGAGTGKTATIAAKVKYLVEKKNIKPSQILVIAFTNKAVDELKDRIKKKLGIPDSCHIHTFHKIGQDIVSKNSLGKKWIIDDIKRYTIIRDIIRDITDQETVNKLEELFKDYFSKKIEEPRLKKYLNYVKNGIGFDKKYEDVRKKLQTIKDEWLKSSPEVEIANFLYLNGIDYNYEEPYPYDMPKLNRKYVPDFKIWQGDGEKKKIAYIEHFGMINSNDKNSSSNTNEINKYIDEKNDKINHHKEHSTTLIATYKDTYNNNILEYLKKELNKTDFVLNTRSDDEIMSMLKSGEENRRMYKFVRLVCQFISNFKVKKFSEQEFANWGNDPDTQESDKLFLEICEKCYQDYNDWLVKNGAIDFEDMINKATENLKNKKGKLKPKYLNNLKYIIIDEYQDISWQRFDFCKTLSDITHAKIFAVGDDWQSIYAFSGSEISLFTEFPRMMGYAKTLQLNKTYRISQELLDITSKFIEKNNEQSKKKLKSENKKDCPCPVQIYTYDDCGENGGKAMAQAIEEVLSDIKEFKVKEEIDPGPILLLGRYRYENNSDLKKLLKSGKFERTESTKELKIKSVKYPQIDITFMTVHAAKGLEFDDVIVINVKDETYGFPCKKEDDPVLRYISNDAKNEDIDYPEERRLFYVAMTRTKNRVFFVAPQQNPSRFLEELEKIGDEIGNVKKEKVEIHFADVGKDNMDEGCSQNDELYEDELYDAYTDFLNDGSGFIFTHDDVEDDTEE